MSKIWEYNGYTVDEGAKPRDDNFKPDHYQYFFIVKKDDARVMKYCVWAPRDGASGLDEIREEGLKRVKQRIDAGDFTNALLEMSPAGNRELPLDDLGEKL